jgi:hypothetical protein
VKEKKTRGYYICTHLLGLDPGVARPPEEEQGTLHLGQHLIHGGAAAGLVDDAVEDLGSCFRKENE